MMGFAEPQESYEVVLFVTPHGVGKEMLYPEFVAVLDHVVGIPDFANSEQQAIYLRVNPHLRITAAVCFTIAFDGRGYADPRWNLPLDHLAQTAGQGPDLGAGPIRLCCRSQCSVPWHQKQLWDPDMRSRNSTLALAAERLRTNRLGLPEPVQAPTRTEPQEPMGAGGALDPRWQQLMRDELAQAKRELHLKLQTQRTAYKAQLDELKQQYRQQCEQLEGRLREREVALEQAREHARRLQQRLQQRTTMEQVERQAGMDRLSEQLQQLEQQHQEALLAQEQALKQRLELREVELFYREQQNQNLRDELAELRGDHEELYTLAADALITRMARQGVAFVVYQPGLDPTSLKPADVAAYLASPQAFVARELGMEEEHYRAWLQHQQLPVCQYQWQGDCCGERVEKITDPRRFSSGLSDRCAEHRQPFRHEGDDA